MWRRRNCMCFESESIVLLITKCRLESRFREEYFINRWITGHEQQTTQDLFDKWIWSLAIAAAHEATHHRLVSFAGDILLHINLKSVDSIRWHSMEIGVSRTTTIDCSWTPIAQQKMESNCLSSKLKLQIYSVVKAVCLHMCHIFD